MPDNAAGARRSRRKGQRAAAGRDAKAEAKCKKRRRLIAPTAYRRQDKNERAAQTRGDGKRDDEAERDKPSPRARPPERTGWDKANEATDSRGPTSEVRGRRSGEAAEGTCRLRRQAVPLDRRVGPHGG